MVNSEITKMASITINGRTIKNNVKGSVCINGNSITVAGVKIEDLESIEERQINIVIEGNIEALSSDDGDITVNGTVTTATTKNGNITCGEVGGDVSTKNGNVMCGSVAGDATTKNGSIMSR